jgi:hypothetical protein
MVCGAYMFGHFSKRMLNPLLWYGILECGAGLLAAVAPLLFGFDTLQRHSRFGLFGLFFSAGFIALGYEIHWVRFLEYLAARTPYSRSRFHNINEKNLENPESVFADKIFITQEAQIFQIREETVHEALKEM